MISTQAVERPGELAVSDLTRWRSWAELADRTTRFARFLREDAGLAPNDRVALLMSNRVEYLELVVGAILAGVWITPVNWHLAPEEIGYVVADSGAKLVVCDDAFETTARAAGASELLRVGAELDTALAAASDVPMPLDGPAGGPMIYTSGTTGQPKGVQRARAASLGAALAGQEAYGHRVGLDGSGPHLITGPMYHAAPLMFAVYDQANGAPVVILPRWDDRRVLDVLSESDIAHTHLVPTMFVRLLRQPEEVRARFAAPRLDLVLHGAAPVSTAVKRRMIDWWGPLFVEYWGGTEGGVNTLVDSKDWLEHPGTVGRALPGFEVFAVDDAGARLPAGEVGQLYCHARGQERVFEYHGDPEKTAAAYLEPGVFTLGDVGFVDADGWVFLVDRKSNMIISGGVNIYPAEIEQVLQEHPAVADVAVFGIPDEEWGESVKAAVELTAAYAASPELAQEILAFGRQHLAGYKVPRSIDFEEALPRHPSGKLYVRRLRDRYWAGRGSRI